MRAHPFTVDIAQELLVDLLDRLARTRWPSEIAGSGWRFGADLNYLRTLLSYWQHEFDWRAQEQRINGFANFHAEVDDIGLHFIHERGKGSHPIPLLLIHGWPSSFVEMLELIPLLTDPASHGMDGRTSFDVVVPSLPGYGFSDRLAQPGAPARRNGELLTQLMTGLGYERFAVHAYDIGASIAGNMALDYPERLIGYHTTEPFMPRPYPYLGDGARELTDAERTHIAYDQQWTADEGGYMAIQRTRPQSLAYGLNDSPVGLAAWIVEKWYAWTAPPSGDLEDSFTKDELLTNITLYWVTQTIQSANQYYLPSDTPQRLIGPHDRVRVPMGVTLNATQRIEHPPREYIERLYADIRQWVQLPRGGHFIALEEPGLVAESLREFFAPLHA